MKPSPRLLWASLASVLLIPSLARAQPLHSQEIVNPTPVALSPADAAKKLTDFRSSRLDGDFCLAFELLHYPRRGDETRFTGIAWGTWNDQGPITRFRLRENNSSSPSTTPPVYWEWLVQNGPVPRIWVLAPGATAAREVPPAEWRAPLFPGTVYTPFDLLMPFLYWADSSYTGPGRVLGRAVDEFTLKPSVSEQTFGLGGVRISLDREFNDLVRVEQLDAKGALVRQLDLGSITEVQGQWMLQSCRLQDLSTRDYDQFTVKAVAMKLKLDAAIFDPAKLSQPAALPPESAWASL